MDMKKLVRLPDLLRESTAKIASAYQFEILHIFNQFLVGNFEVVSMCLQPLHAVTFIETELGCTVVSFEEFNKGKERHM